MHLTMSFPSCDPPCSHSLMARTDTWKPAAPPASVAAIKDPFFRVMSGLRLRLCCTASVKYAISDRGQGKFGKPKTLTAEPARTERLLQYKSPITFRYDNAGDSFDAYQFAYFPRSNGRNLLNPFFDHYGLVSQMTIAMLSGAGGAITKGSTLANLQVGAIGALQILHSLFCFVLFPSCDKADSWMQGARPVRSNCAEWRSSNGLPA